MITPSITRLSCERDLPSTTHILDFKTFSLLLEERLNPFVHHVFLLLSIYLSPNIIPSPPTIVSMHAVLRHLPLLQLPSLRSNHHGQRSRHLLDKYDT